MNASSRWQDWVNVVLGALLFISVFAFGATSLPAAEWTGFIVGVLLFVVGIYALVSPQLVSIEWAEVVLGVLLFISPWVLAFTGLTSMAWTAWIIGILAVIAAGWVLLTERGNTQSHASS